jgi:5-methylcytosine-specific restriction endonuclease McrA
MDQKLEQEVRRRARHRCEYCVLAESTSVLKHVIDHVIARQHGGKTVSENLALCCGRCNLCKGPNIAGIDPDTAALARLFHPRLDEWEAHFRWEHAVLVGLTPIGRTTAVVLAINDPRRIALRRMLAAFENVA